MRLQFGFLGEPVLQCSTEKPVSSEKKMPGKRLSMATCLEAVNVALLDGDFFNVQVKETVVPSTPVDLVSPKQTSADPKLS